MRLQRQSSTQGEYDSTFANKVCQLTETDWQIPPFVSKHKIAEIIPDDAHELQIAPTELFLRDMWRVAFHEAAHVIVARHFRAVANATIYPAYSNTAHEKIILGITYLSPSLTKAQCSYIAWAGPIADAIDLRKGTLTPDLDELFDSIEIQVHSHTDLNGMSAYPHRWRACKTAYKILVREQTKLSEYGHFLVEAFWEQLRDSLGDAAGWHNFDSGARR